MKTFISLFENTNFMQFRYGDSLASILKIAMDANPTLKWYYNHAFKTKYLNLPSTKHLIQLLVTITCKKTTLGK